MRTIAAAFALGAADEDIAEKLHLDLLETVPATALATARPGVEREGAGRQPLRAGFIRRGEKFANGIENTKVNGRGGTRRAGERRLIDHDDLGDAFRAGERT